MRQVFVVAGAQGGLPRVAGQGLAQGGFDAGVATAENHQLATQIDQFRQHGRHQVQTFLFAQAGHRRKQECVGPFFQAEQTLQGALDTGLAAHALAIKMGIEQRVCGRVPELVVNAIEDAADTIAPVAQHAVQAAALFWRHDLLGVAWTDGGDGVGKLQTGFHEGKLPVVFRTVDGEQGLWHAEFGTAGGRKQSLVSQVVDGEHAGRDTASAGQQLLVKRSQTGMPVVRMHHVGLPVGVGALP